MKKLSGEKAFDQYFTQVYGEEWVDIKNALLSDETKVARRNLFYPSQDLPLGEEIGVGEKLRTPENCYEIFENFDLSRFDTPLLPYYRMDPASIFPAKALEVKPGEKVLDMCAAPGGKTLVLVEDLMAANSDSLQLEGQLIANEMSAKRKHRMMSVFKRYLPLEVRQRVKIRGVDGSVFGLEKKEYFDRILLDAPCSGERGVLAKKSELEQWKEKRTKSFAIRQYALLNSAFMSLKPGGRIVYSTCSISPYENDGVIDKLHKRHKGEFDILKSEISVGKQTEWGRQFLPNQDGWGPIYFSVIEKN